MQITTKGVCVVGLGYIGLPTAALLANKGYTVHGVDISQKVVDVINQGKIHIIEPDLDVFVQAAVTSGRFRASTCPVPADVFMICVPTPFIHDESEIPQPDLAFVRSAARSIAAHTRPGNLVILESTSPVGTTEMVRDTLAECGVDVGSLHFSYCPERVLPGHIMVELIENDRVVGGLTAEATAITAAFYRTFVSGEVLQTDSRTAEMCKLVENSFRDVNIAFANELSMLCDTLDIEVRDLIRLANHHPRVNILQPGCGVGGHCIAVDPWFIVAKDPERARLIRAAREVNNYKNEWVAEKIKNTALQFQLEHGRAARIGCFGLSFKPDIDDLRESPALAIALSLKEAGFEVFAVEPNIESHDQLGLMTFSDGVKVADIIVWLVKHRQFAAGSDIGGKVILDFCGVTFAA